MIMGNEELDRIEELQKNEMLLYACIEYLVEVWSINENEEEMKEHFKTIGFADEDIERLEKAEILNFD